MFVEDGQAVAAVSVERRMRWLVLFWGGRLRYGSKGGIVVFAKSAVEEMIMHDQSLVLLTITGSGKRRLMIEK